MWSLTAVGSFICLSRWEASRPLVSSSPVSSLPCSLIDPSIIRQKTSVKHFLTCWPWPLTYDLDLRTWPRYSSNWPTHQRSGLYVCPFGRESVHRQTDRQTMSKLLHPSLTRGVMTYTFWVWMHVVYILMVLVTFFLWNVMKMKLLFKGWRWNYFSKAQWAFSFEC